MPNRNLIVVALAVIVGFAGSVTAADGTDWVLPRTPWGAPDFQGVWTNETITPFERPAGQEGKSVLSEDEAATILIEVDANSLSEAECRALERTHRVLESVISS